MKKAFVVLALCLCALPAMQARSLTEEELLESTALLLNMEAGAQLSAEEQMLLATSGMYGSPPLGSYGGIIDPPADPTPDSDDDLSEEPALDLESGTETPKPPATNTNGGAPANTGAKAAASSAFAADKSAAMLVAGMMVAVSAFLL